MALNEDGIAAAAARDGLRGIDAWGCGEADPRDLVAQHRRLSEIEACFRANKHDLKIRPIFHWRDRRIQAHIAICYMAFSCLQHQPPPPVGPGGTSRALTGSAGR